MKTFASIATLSMLSACATNGADMQYECEAKHSYFPEIYQCTYHAVATRNPAILKDPRAKLYLLRGEQLAEEVTSKKISNVDAKVFWQRLFVEIKASRDKDTATAIESITRSIEASRAANNALIGNSQVNCTSQRFGDITQTNCR